MSKNEEEPIDLEVNLLKCNKCNLYSHLSCSMTNFEALENLAHKLNNTATDEPAEIKTPKSIYECLECLLIGRLPSFYLYQQCEMFANLHQAV